MLKIPILWGGNFSILSYIHFIDDQKEENFLKIFLKIGKLYEYNFARSISNKTRICDT